MVDAVLTLFRMDLFWATDGWGRSKKGPLYISYKNEHSYTFSKEDLKKY